ncbi:MAG: hypothetical protein N2A42_05695 [Luteolibacter sp.]
MTGKWHVGAGQGLNPPDRGFYLNRHRIEPPDDLYVTDDFTDQAIGFIDEAVTETI